MRFASKNRQDFHWVLGAERYWGLLAFTTSSKGHRYERSKIGEVTLKCTVRHCWR